jgi:uncharacterized protein
MKYVLLIAVVLLVLWLLKPRRRVEPPAQRKAVPGTEPMVVCAHCGVHLPSSDALPGRGGVFCGEAHRQAHEAAAGR